MNPQRSPLVVVLLGLMMQAPAPPARSNSSPRTVPTAPTDSIRLVIGGYLLGSISEDGCCPGHPSGGLPRRVAAYDALRREKSPVLAVEAGDFAFFRQEPRAWEGTRVTARLLARLGNAAWTPGEWELSFGADGVRLLAEAMKAPVVSANLMNRDGDLLFADARVCVVGGRRVGITGVTAPRLLRIESAGVPGSATAIVAGDMAEALPPIVTELRRECEAVIVLAHVSPAEAESLARAVPGIDVMVVGHNPGYLEEAVDVAGARLLRGGNRGSVVGSLGVHFSGGRVETDPRARLTFLPGSSEADSATLAVVDSFMTVRSVLDRRERQNRARDPGYRAGGDRFLGVEACGRCHDGIATQWDTGRHARAYWTLVGVGQGRNPNCLPCHTTGFLEPTGAEAPPEFGAGHPATPADSALTHRLYGVQCEACHGRGSRHGEPDFRAPITAATCIRCHDAANDPDFDLVRAMAGGIHAK